MVARSPWGGRCATILHCVSRTARCSCNTLRNLHSWGGKTLQSFVQVTECCPSFGRCGGFFLFVASVCVGVVLIQSPACVSTACFAVALLPIRPWSVLSMCFYQVSGSVGRGGWILLFLRELRSRWRRVGARCCKSAPKLWPGLHDWGQARARYGKSTPKLWPGSHN